MLLKIEMNGSRWQLLETAVGDMRRKHAVQFLVRHNLIAIQWQPLEFISPGGCDMVIFLHTHDDMGSSMKHIFETIDPNGW